MIASERNESTSPPEVWEQEILARHRWGRHDDRAPEELALLKPLWEAACPLDEPCQAIMEQIIALEICNWYLEESILALCGAIGAKEPLAFAVGHLASVSEARWKEVWAYYLALRNWLPREGRSGYGALLGVCDPEEAIQKRVLSLLGERNDLKELCVERLCLCLELWLGGIFPRESAQMVAHGAAVSAVEEEITRHHPEGQILKAMKLDGDGRLQPCHHKAFRRYDIIISSIGAGRWRAVMPMRGTDGFERAATLEEYLAPIQAWIGGRGTAGRRVQGELHDEIHMLLGESDEAKLFLASLLVSILRAQQLSATARAQKRTKVS